MVMRMPPIILVPYQEVVGPLNSLEEREGALFIEIAHLIIILPFEMAEVLTPLLGSRMSIIHTDIFSKEYLVRVLEEPISKEV